MSKRNDQISSLILIAIALTTFILTLQFPDLPVQDTGPAYFPQMLSIILLILGALIFLTSYKKSYSEERKSMKKPLLTIGLVLLYLLGIKLIGFVIMTPIFAFTIMFFLGARNKITLISLPLGVILFVYLFFEKALSIPLPAGLLF